MFGKILKELRELEGWNQIDVAKKLKISKQTYNNYELGKRKPDWDTVFKLADIYEVDVGKLLGRESSTSKELPIVGQIACGPTEVAYEEIEGYETVPVSWLNGEEHFFLRAKGDSMINVRIHEGDLLLIRRQDDVDNGEIAVVVINDEATLKRVYKVDGKLMMQAENSDYKPIILEGGDVRIIGKLIKVVLNF